MIKANHTTCLGQRCLILCASLTQGAKTSNVLDDYSLLQKHRLLDSGDGSNECCCRCSFRCRLYCHLHTLQKICGRSKASASIQGNFGANELCNEKLRSFRLVTAARHIDSSVCWRFVADACGLVASHRCVNQIAIVSTAVCSASDGHRSGELTSCKEGESYSSNVTRGSAIFQETRPELLSAGAEISLRDNNAPEAPRLRSKAQSTG